MSYPGFNFLDGVFTASQQAELQQFAAYLQGYLQAQHKDDGSHGNITADSINLIANAAASPPATGNIIADGSADIDGNVTADADGDPVITGRLAAEGGFSNVVNGLDMRSGTTSRWRMGTTASSGSSHQLFFEDMLGTAGAGGFTFRFYYDGTNYVLDHDAGVGLTLGVAGRRATAAYLLGLDYSSFWRQNGDISPAQITSNQNNYNPSGLSTANVIRLNVDAARTITGLVAQSAGTRITLLNVSGGGGFDITLAHADTANSAAANVFICPGFANYTLAKGGGVDIWYDGTSSVWRLVA